jgi:hypothetical protein
VGLAIAIAAALAPSILEFQKERVLTPEKRSRRMPELTGITESAAEKRFGKPMSVHDYSLSYGTFAGPRIGQKHYYLFKWADYQEHVKDAETVWGFPQYSAIREIIWKLPDSYLTIWLHEPRAEMSLGDGDTIDLTLPTASSGDWVALDNYRVGLERALPPKDVH